MEAAERRSVRSGKEYDNLFPLPTGNDIRIKKSAEVSDTVRFIQEKTPQTKWQTEKLARLVKGDTLEDTCSNLWNFLYEHIRYKRDEDGIEQVRSPRRTWRDRNIGVDCDCFTVIVSSTLMNLGIPHKYRITKYPKTKEQPRWQHIYVVVPIDGNLKTQLDNRSDYIVIDVVKEAFDDEQAYLEFKDFNANTKNMRLDYLDGLEGDEEYQVPSHIDAQDIAAIYDEEELGKIGKWVKKTVKKAGTTVKKAAAKVSKVRHVINRFTNPGTIALRNGFLLAMKINFMNVAKRMRYAYMNDQQASAIGINLSELAKLRKIKDKAENIYYQAGGKKENLKKAILSGKGNKDRKVPLNGLYGLGEVYADQEEYDILYGLGDLGDPASGAAIVAATSVIAALAGALKSVKGLFKPGSPKTENFNSDSDAEAQAMVNSGAAADPLPAISDEGSTAEPPATTSQFPEPAKAIMQIAPPQNAGSGNAAVTQAAETQTNETTTAPENTGEQGFFAKAGTWVKENKGTALLIGGVLVAGAIYLSSHNKSSHPARTRNSNNLDGTGGTKKKRKKTTVRKVKIR